jgi:membrane protein required for beta-lactamase induction
MKLSKQPLVKGFGIASSRPAAMLSCPGGTHMKPLLVVTAIWLVMSGGATSVQRERSAIQAVLDAHADAWTRGDAHAAAALMTEDADWISGGGHIFQGRAAIEQMHRELLAGPAKGSRHMLRAH